MKTLKESILSKGYDALEEPGLNDPALKKFAHVLKKCRWEELSSLSSRVKHYRCDIPSRCLLTKYLSKAKTEKRGNVYVWWSDDAIDDNDSPETQTGHLSILVMGDDNTITEYEIRQPCWVKTRYQNKMQLTIKYRLTRQYWDMHSKRGYLPGELADWLRWYVMLIK
jgi:hypothetical protein